MNIENVMTLFSNVRVKSVWEELNREQWTANENAGYDKSAIESRAVCNASEWLNRGSSGIRGRFVMNHSQLVTMS